MSAKQGSARRRERSTDAPRSNRVNLAFNDLELTMVTAAAGRENMTPGAWTSKVAVAVAEETLIPVSTDHRQVLEEFIRAREQLRRIGNNLNQVAYALNADGTVTDAQLRAVLERVEVAVAQVDAGTVQVMRERVARP